MSASYLTFWMAKQGDEHRLSAIRKLAIEAADNGLLAPELAAGIAHVKGAKSVGIRVGNWLSVLGTAPAAVVQHVDPAPSGFFGDYA
jgi:hypothetical protein